MTKEHPLRRIVRQNIRNRRIALGLYQRQLASRLGVSQVFVSDLESAKRIRIPSLIMLYNLAKALKTTPEDLVTEGRFPETNG